MQDASLPLQIAIKTRLLSEVAVTQLVGGRTFDAVPAGEKTYPYLTLGNAHALEAGADCIPGAEISVDVHVWSRATGSAEAKRICAAIADCLHEADLDLGPEAALAELFWTGTLVFRDEDGLTTHGVASFRALTESV